MARKAIDPDKKRIPRGVIRANKEEWAKIKRNAVTYRSVNDFAVTMLSK